MTIFSKNLDIHKPIKIGEKAYIFDMSRVFEILEQNIYQKETTTAYDFADENSPMASRVIREIENRDVSTVGNLKYDFLKLLIVTVLEWPLVVDDEEEGEVKSLGISGGLIIAMNTLIDEGILKEIKEFKEYDDK